MAESTPTPSIFRLKRIAPDSLLADLAAAGFYPPFRVDPKAPGLLLDRGDHTVAPIGPVPNRPGLRGKLVEYLVETLNALAAEERAIRDPFDPPHLDAVAEQSRGLPCNRSAAE